MPQMNAELASMTSATAASFQVVPVLASTPVMPDWLGGVVVASADGSDDCSVTEGDPLLSVGRWSVHRSPTALPKARALVPALAIPTLVTA